MRGDERLAHEHAARRERDGRPVLECRRAVLMEVECDRGRRRRGGPRLDQLDRVREERFVLGPPRARLAEPGRPSGRPAGGGGEEHISHR